MFAVTGREGHIDYEGYQLIYDFGGSWLMSQGRDPLFVYLLEQAHGVMTYEEFRYILCGVFGITLLWLAPRFAAMSETGRFGLVQAVFLTPLVLLKFHVQIREGLAILLWLVVVTSNYGIPRRSAKFWILAALSSLIHLAAVIWWAVTFMLATKRPKHVRAALVTFALFALYGLLTTSEGRLFFEGTEFFREGDTLNITPAKGYYWSLFLILPALVLYILNRKALTLNGHPSPFGMAGTYGLLGFFSVALLGAVIWGATDADFSSTLRIANTLAIFLTIQMGLTRPQWAISWTVFLFAMSDVVRLVAH